MDQNLAENDERFMETLLRIYMKQAGAGDRDRDDHHQHANNNNNNNEQQQLHIGGMTNLELRRFFRAKAFNDEMIDWYYVNDRQPRNVPDMGPVFSRIFEQTVHSFIVKYSLQEILLGYDHIIDIEEDVNQRFHNLLILHPPQTTSCFFFYCLHCQNTVDISTQQQQHLCPMCGGWYLFEMDPAHPELLPVFPTNWERVCNRLRPLIPDDQQPPLSDDAITEVDITDLQQQQADQYSSCPICDVQFEVGNPEPSAAAAAAAGKLPCGHLFHVECISKWFNMKSDRRHCAICRRLVPTVDPLFNILLRLTAMEEGYPPPLP